MPSEVKKKSRPTKPRKTAADRQAQANELPSAGGKNIPVCENLPAEATADVSSLAQEEGVKTSRLESNRLELLITIVERQKGEFYADVIQTFDVNMQTLVRARGTANAKTLEMLGLQDNSKAVIFSVIREDRVQDALAALKRRFGTIKNGKGIAYTVPLTSVIGVALYGFLSNNKGMAAKE